MTKKQAVEIAAAYFKNHSVNEFFVTNDEQVFFEKVAAENHATGLLKNSNTVHFVTRLEAEDIGNDEVFSDVSEVELNTDSEEQVNEEQLNEGIPDNSAPTVRKPGRPKKEQN